jgi:hypothetical protein
MRSPVTATAAGNESSGDVQNFKIQPAAGGLEHSPLTPSQQQRPRLPDRLPLPWAVCN